MTRFCWTSLKTHLHCHSSASVLGFLVAVFTVREFYLSWKKLRTSTTISLICFVAERDAGPGCGKLSLHYGTGFLICVWRPACCILCSQNASAQSCCRSYYFLWPKSPRSYTQQVIFESVLNSIKDWWV